MTCLGSETPKVPEASYLSQNYPNPFNPMTKVAFGLSVPGRVSLRIYDAAGWLVRVLIEGARAAKHYTDIWDGRDEEGRGVSSGVYFYRLDAGTFKRTRKMVYATVLPVSSGKIGFLETRLLSATGTRQPVCSFAWLTRQAAQE